MCALTCVSDFRYVVLFRNYKRPHLRQISHFSTYVKFTGGVGEMSESKQSFYHHCPSGDFDFRYVAPFRNNRA